MFLAILGGFFEGNTPSVASPANISLFVVLLRPPHPRPWECPPCSHDPPRYPKGLFPFPTALPGKQGTTDRAGQGGGDQERTRAANRAPWSVEKAIKGLAGITAPSQTPGCWMAPLQPAPPRRSFRPIRAARPGQGRHPSENTRGRHPSGSEPRIPQEAKAASLAKHRAPLRGSPRAGLTHGHHPHPKLGGFPPPATPIP